MTELEFAQLAALMRLRVNSSASSRALKRVLVDGCPLQQAAILERIDADHVRTIYASAKTCLQRVKALQVAAHSALAP